MYYRYFMRYRYRVAIGASIILGVIFIVSGLGKLLGQNTLLINILLFPRVNPGLATIASHGLPWVELILGVFLVMGICAQLAASFSFVLIAAFIYYNSWMIFIGMGYKPCGCLGILEKLFLGTLSNLDSLYIDIGLFMLALIIYFCYSGNFFNMRPWFIKGKSKVETVAPMSSAGLPKSEAP